jgi:predicted NBD/HSP70 family sugar kinase
MGLYLGMDIGGTSLKLGAWDAGRRIAWRDALPLPDTGDEQAVKRHLQAMLTEFCGEHSLAPDGLGIGSCGVISGGRIFQSPNTPWDRLPLVPLLAPELNYPVALLNDADAFLVHALEDLPDTRAVVLGITLGTGVGTGLWIRDSLYRGGAGISPEGGHISIEFNAGRGTSRIPGTWESFASRDALLRYFREAGGIGAEDPQQVARLAEGGDHAAISAWNRFGGMVGVGLASLCNFLSPDYALIGGGLAGASALFEQSLNAAVELHMLRAMPRPDIRFVNDRPDSVAHGAMLYAQREVSNEL